MTELPPEDTSRAARNRLRGFLNHLIIYFSAMIVLAPVNFFLTPDRLWFVFPWWPGSTSPSTPPSPWACSKAGAVRLPVSMEAIHERHQSRQCLDFRQGPGGLVPRLTVDEARKRGLAGWVRNRKDGTVEAVFAGPAEQVDDMVQACHQGPPRQGRRRGRHAGIVSPWREFRAALNLLSYWAETSSSHSCSVNVVTPSA